MGENILNPDFFDYLLSVQTLKKQNGKQRQRILSVCFQRLAEFVTEITDEKEKEEYVTELFQKSSFKETSQFISNELDHFSFRFLTSILGSLVQMTSKDIFLIECIGNELLIRLEQKPDPKLAKMVPSFLQNNHKAGIPQMLFDVSKVSLLDSIAPGERGYPCYIFLFLHKKVWSWYSLAVPWQDAFNEFYNICFMKK